MGAAASQPKIEFKSETPVQFSEELLNQIKNNTDNDYTRELKADKYIQKEVTKSLARLEQETLATFEDKLNTSLLSNVDEDSSNELSSALLSGKVTKLNSHLNNLIDQQVNKVGGQDKKDELKVLRETLFKCLTNNEGKPLNCYEEVQKFKEFANSI